MDDCVVHWSLDALRVINAYAFVGTAPNPQRESVTISFWFWAKAGKGRQVLANKGCMTDEQPGWTVFLDGAVLHFRVTSNDLHRAELQLTLAKTAEWQHFVGVIDRQNQRLIGYLNGDSSGWQAGENGVGLSSAPISPDADLVIGGYTDPAGGHFDHTFGRSGSGLIDDFRLFARALSADEVATFVDRDNQPPVARFAITKPSGEAPVRVRFDAGASTDADGQIQTYWWDFGDGSSGYGLTPEHDYAYAGNYTICLTVIDDDHAQATTTQTLTLSGQANPLHIHPVFVNGTEGYACYRIPSIVRAVNGDLVAFAEGRVESCSDSTRTIRIVCKRSADNGASWSPVQVVGRNIFNGEEYAAQNCSPVVDTQSGTGRMVVLFNKLEYSEWDIAAGTGISRICSIYSDDNGLTWHGEKDITPYVHKPFNPDYAAVYPEAAQPENRAADWRIQRPTLGHAIQLTGPNTPGRLVYIGVRTQGDQSVFDSQNYAFWSDDLGQTWTIGAAIPQTGLNEAIAVELENGDVMVNSRGYRNQQSLGRRAVTIGSFDSAGGITFGGTYPDQTLVDPAVQASMIRYTRSDEAEYGGKSRILFSNPNHPHARRNMTVRLSYDEGHTWPVSKTIDPGPAAYSDLVIQADGRMGLLYERGNQGGIYYVNFTLDWLTDSTDTFLK